MKVKKNSIFNRQIIILALKQAFSKLNPTLSFTNATVFVTELAFIIIFIFLIIGVWTKNYSKFEIQIALWVFLTMLFATFCEALAEGRGKAQATHLRRKRTKTKAKLLKNIKAATPKVINASRLKVGDIILCQAGDIIPADGEVVDGIATVDESAITGESAPVIRESGGDCSAVTGGTKVLSDQIKIKITLEAGSGFLDRMISLVEEAKRNKTPSEMSLNVVLSGLSIMFMISTIAIKILTDYSANLIGKDMSQTLPVYIYITVIACLTPTTIGSLVSAIGISGMDRLFQKNVIALSGRAVEAAGDIDVLLLDKTGTITLGNRQAVEFIAEHNIPILDFAKTAQLASISDETPEGRSIVVLAKRKYDQTAEFSSSAKLEFVPFSAYTKTSGVNINTDNEKILLRKGSVAAITRHVQELGGKIPASTTKTADIISKTGGTPLILAKNNEVLGVIHLKDVVKGGIKEKFAQLKQMGIKTVMITGDNPLTSAAIAAESGVDDFLADATPETKLLRIKEEQSQGLIVAMAGDGANDAPALAQADVGLAMNTGTQAAREAGNMVDLDSNPTKLIEIVTTGKQILMTRGSLTTFSIASDVAKYFAILPALFGGLYSASEQGGPLALLNIMKLGSFKSAILSATIFNALLILGLVPLALGGVKTKMSSPQRALVVNLVLYGLGGLLLPFIFIKLIDMLINFFHLV